jgi:hypothetical protein
MNCTSLDLYLQTNNNKIMKNTENKKPIMWRCNRQLRMSGTKEICFKNGGTYEQIEENPLSLRDEQGHYHELSHWERWFKKLED